MISEVKRLLLLLYLHFWDVGLIILTALEDKKKVSVWESLNSLHLNLY